jgi:hypothetical protein
MATAIGPDRPSPHRGRIVHWLSKVFEVNPAGLDWQRGVMLLDVALVPLVVFWSIGHEEYLLSALFGMLYTAAAGDPGGRYGSRASRGAVFGLIGAALTALGFTVGGYAWGPLVLAAFIVTLAAGLMVTFGVHRFAAATFLYQWFIIALAVAYSEHHTTHKTSYTWAQVLAWAGGVALWIAVTFIAWLIRGRKNMPAPFTEIPGDTSRHRLTGPVITFAVLRAVVIAGTVALAFGLNLSHGIWLVIAATIAMKPSLQQSMLTAIQRLLGASIGAAAAMLLLLIPANEHGQQLVSITHGLDVIAIVLFLHAVAIFFWNYAWYAAAEAAGVLILIDLPQPSNYGAEGYRVLWTLCGVGLAVLVLLLARMLPGRSSQTPPAPTTQPG